MMHRPSSDNGGAQSVGPQWLWRLTLLPACCVAALGVAGRPSVAADADHVLRYDQPAQEWVEALPVGNGSLGCMAFGGVAEARYQFNHDTLWTGGPHDYANDDAHEHLAEIRRLLLSGEQRAAQDLAGQEFMSQPLRQASYQPFGDLVIAMDHDAPAAEYRRTLDLRTATAAVTYRVGESLYTRRVIASHPDGVIAVRIECDRPRGLSFTARLTSPHPNTAVRAGADSLLLTGYVGDQTTTEGYTFEGQTQFAARLRVVSDGAIEPARDGLRVTGATEATLLLAPATSYVNFRDLSGDPQARSEAILRAAPTDWDTLRERHEQDHKRLYDRVSLRLGESSTANTTTDQRVLDNAASPDASLAALLFNYGRYLMIASSRPGGQPANLQGLWNDRLEPPWQSKYTTNINTEMNYWLIEPCGLEECGEPLFAALEEVARSGEVTAKEQYAAPGWVLHHNFDLWRGTAPINASNHGIWPTGGAWLCQHLWERYLHSGDDAFLRDKAYPLMKGSAAFFAGYLLEDPRRDDGWLISGPSNSPEIGGLVMGPTMDHQIIRALFRNTADAADTLGTDRRLAERWRALAARIAPNQVGRHGQLQEWLEDKDDPANKHRHVSHLWGLHPGSEITPDTPELFAAARRSLEYRGDGGTGWSRAWKINFWARLRDGDRAHSVLQGLLTLTGSPKTDYRGGGVYPNLMDAHPPFQIDGNFGATNGVCEMLVQSHRTTDEGTRIIELLPALPTAWASGHITGLRARDGFVIDLSWEGGKLKACNVESRRGRPAIVRCQGAEASLSLAPSKSADFGEKLARR